MEEDKKTVVEQTEQSLSKEEILERSRKENAKKDDEREQKLIRKGDVVALEVGWLVSAILLLLDRIVLHKYNPELVIAFCITTVVDLILAGKFSTRYKKIYLSLGIIGAIITVTMVVLWILQLCGVTSGWNNG